MTGADGQEPYVKEEEGPRQRRSDALINRLLETHFPALFHTASALSRLFGAPSPLGEG